MAHTHSVYDTDAHFKIDPVTRLIKNVSTGKTVLIQYDHNSERFTFEIPRLVDGHDMNLCNRVEVHYINIDSADKTKTSADLYPVDDIQISPDADADADDVVICSWLISHNATKYAGSLNFLLQFKCVDDSGDIVYRWNTAIFTGISVSSGIDNGEIVVEEYSDVLEQWRQELIESGGVTDDRIQAAVEAYLEENPVEGSSVYIGAVQPTDGTLYWLDTSASGGVAEEYEITAELTNATIDNAADTVNEGESYSASISVAEGYILESVSVKMGGKDITGTNYADGNIFIAFVTGNIEISVSARALNEDEKVYTITNNLVNVTSNNSAVSASGNSTYTATLTAGDGYALDVVTVTMGGVDVTANVYADGVINISAVTGDVIITASAVDRTLVENLLSDDTKFADGIYISAQYGNTWVQFATDTSYAMYKVPITAGTYRIVINTTNAYTEYYSGQPLTSGGTISKIFMVTDGTVLDSASTARQNVAYVDPTGTLAEKVSNDDGTYTWNIDVAFGADGDAYFVERLGDTGTTRTYRVYRASDSTTL